MRKNLNHYDWNFEDYDIEILFRPNETEEKFKFATGVIAVANNENTIRFFEEWNNEIKDKLYKWFSDQITFNKVFLNNKNKLRFKPLKEEMIDWNFKIKSILWVGKGTRKYRNLSYKLESLKYNINNSLLLSLIKFTQNLLNFPMFIMNIFNKNSFKK